jgi:hypothetical protein
MVHSTYQWNIQGYVRRVACLVGDFECDRDRSRFEARAGMEKFTTNTHGVAYVLDSTSASERAWSVNDDQHNVTTRTQEQNITIKTHISTQRNTCTYESGKQLKQKRKREGEQYLFSCGGRGSRIEMNKHETMPYSANKQGEQGNQNTCNTMGMRAGGSENAVAEKQTRVDTYEHIRTQLNHQGEQSPGVVDTW